MRRRHKLALVVLILALVPLAALLRMLRYGLSAQDQPTALEHALARALRHYAVPAELRDRKNPVPLTADVLAEARAHFADHCATCHGNDGKGDTAIGRNLYPKAPDMTRPETQSQGDGELFATIENGVRLTGMPGWGDGSAASAYASWTLVHFIRHMPKLTTAELQEMRELNPKSREEWEQAQEERRFLAGEGADAPAPKPAGHKH